VEIEKLLYFPIGAELPHQLSCRHCAGAWKRWIHGRVRTAQHFITAFCVQIPALPAYKRGTEAANRKQ